MLCQIPQCHVCTCVLTRARVCHLEVLTMTCGSGLVEWINEIRQHMLIWWPPEYI